MKEFCNCTELKNYMEENNLEHLSEVEGAGFKQLDNFGGMAILINYTGEAVFYQDYDGKIKKARIGQAYCTEENRYKTAFSDECGENWFLDEFMKVRGFKVV